MKGKAPLLFDSHALMSFTDCIALVSAVEHGAVPDTGDPEFREVERLVTIAWV